MEAAAGSPKAKAKTAEGLKVKGPTSPKKMTQGSPKKMAHHDKEKKASVQGPFFLFGSGFSPPNVYFPLNFMSKSESVPGKLSPVKTGVKDKKELVFFNWLVGTCSTVYGAGYKSYESYYKRVTVSS